MKKIFSIITIVASIHLTSCNGFGPIDKNIKTENVDFNNDNIIGTWKLDKFSYDYLSKKNKTDSIYITFNKDKTFVLNNSNTLFQSKSNTEINSKKNGTVDNIQTKGNWTIVETQYDKTIQLFFGKNIIQSGLSVFQKGNEYQIWCFFGDPDSGERLRFVKN